MPDQEILLISAKLPTIDFSLWQPLGDLFNQKPKTVNTVETIFDLQLSQWKVSEFQLSDISARITPMMHGFDAVFTSDIADGSVSLFRDAAQPPMIALNRLKLSDKLGSNSAGLDPRRLIAADFSVDWLTIADQEMGSLSFELRPEPLGHHLIIYLEIYLVYPPASILPKRQLSFSGVMMVWLILVN